jgi:predicted DsbA family dithiol-disulfide isomerase
MDMPRQPIPLRIDIVSDVVCPWCIIGYKQLQLALARMDGAFELEIYWQPFELNPRMPDEGQELREHLAEKYGTSPEQSQAARARLTALGDALDFHFDYFDGMRIYNTFKAHQLLHWAGEQSQAQAQQTGLKLALFDAFFRRRENVGDTALLPVIAARAGLPEAEARQVLADQRYAEAVRRDQAMWLERDVHAVPMFYFNNGYPVPGAQAADTFVGVLSRLQERANPGVAL